MNDAKTLGLAAALAGLLLSGCAGTGPADPQDPWRGSNQVMFDVNTGVDDYLLEPVADGWDFVLPNMVQTGVGNFFDNLDMPMIFANNLLQGDWRGALDDLNRFLVNTTVGIAGLIDVASDVGIARNDEDFGQTLGVWGVGSGPYVQLPLLGPSTVRDALALPVDLFSRPHVWFLPLTATVPMGIVNAVNTRAEFDDDIQEAKDTAIDYYIFVREAYLQNREKRVRDGLLVPDESIYDLDYDLEEDEDAY